MSGEDPFGTAYLRERVLASWVASPDRFREDANAEEDLTLGGYRDRLVVELAQNAADAATRAGVPGRLLLRLAPTPDGPLLVAANTGRPLDAAGVRALASLRASAKRDEATSVGRFGVGFAAVLAVTDEPVVVSRAGGVRFSREDTLALVRAAARGHPELAAELDRRGQHVPVLRLPFPAAARVAPVGYDTAVLLPLRDGAAEDLATRLLAAVDDALLLALPGLAEVVVELPGRPPARHRDVADRWHTARRSGVHPVEVLADRPTEERERRAWSVTWALPRREAHPRPEVPPVLHAPTPTDEPLHWAALLVATFPLDPTRRHVAPGPAADAVLAASAATYCDLLGERAAAGEDVLPFVPTGLPAGALDARLRDAVLAELPRVPLLRAVHVHAPPASQDGGLVRPRNALAVEGVEHPEALRALAPVVPGLVAAPPAARAALHALGVRQVALADVVEQLPADPDPLVWAERYAALAPLADDPLAREALAAVPVPLADGRVVRGVRGAWLPEPGLDDDVLAPLSAFGLRVVHPWAAGAEASRLLERLGARRGAARDLLDDLAVRAAVEAAAEAAEDAEDGRGPGGDVVPAVLGLVSAALRAGSLRAGELAWLGDLPLPASDGEPAPAAGLVLPGGVAASVLDPDEVVEVAVAVVERWGEDVLEAVGVARSLAVVRARDVDPADLPPELDLLHGIRTWAAGLPDGTAEEVTALRDLDLVRDGAWPDVLAAIGADRALRDVVTAPVLVQTPDGTAERAPSYSTWWLRRHLRLAHLADPEADPLLAAVLEPAPRWLAGADAGLRAALGLVRDWEGLQGDGWAGVLTRLVEAEPPVASVLAAWRALAHAAVIAEAHDGPGRLDLDPPRRLRVPFGQGSQVVDAADVAVADAPMWVQRPDVGALLPAPAAAAAALADVLDLDLASERARGRVHGPGAVEPVPDAALAVLPAAPATWREHEVLLVDGAEVEWWVEGDGTNPVVHAATLAGLARGLAQACGRWEARLAVEAALVDPAAVVSVLVEEALAP